MRPVLANLEGPVEVNCVRRRLLATGDNGSDPEAHTLEFSSVHFASLDAQSVDSLLSCEAAVGTSDMLACDDEALVMHALWLAQCERCNSF